MVISIIISSSLIKTDCVTPFRVHKWIRISVFHKHEKSIFLRILRRCSRVLTQANNKVTIEPRIHGIDGRDVLGHNDFQAERYPAVRKWGHPSKSMLAQVVLTTFMVKSC